MRAQMASFVSSLRSPEILLPNITAAAILAVMNITTAISVGALVFSGPLSPFLSIGIGLFLIGTAVGGVLVAAGSGYKAIIAGPRSGQAPIVASLVAGIALTMDAQPIEAIVATSVTAILAASIFISCILFGLGWAKLGGLVRYIPYPVMGGFFAGLGFLLFKGGALVTLGSIATLEEPSSFLSANVALHFAPALTFAILLFVLEQHIRHWSLMPIFIFTSIALFYIALFAAGLGIDEAKTDLWMPTINSSEASFFPVLTFDQLALVDWTAILRQSSTILVLALMSVIMLLLDTSGVEIVIGRDLDPNHELKVAGWANIINALCTGPIAIQAAADTAFTYKLGGTRFIMLLVYGLLVVGAILVGPAPIAFIPTFIMGGLLMYIGIDFLMTWVWKARLKLPLKDFAVICTILLVVAIYGILEGVAMGVVLAIFLFVHSYSQLSVVKSCMSGSEHVSNVDRNRNQSRYLDQHGDELQIFVLQGFLFFGTASRLLEEIRAFLEDPDRSKIRYLVMDFNRVDAMDTSAANSFAKLMQICNQDEISLILTGCSDDIRERLSSLTADNQAKGGEFHFFDDLDDGTSWCDDHILKGFTDEEEGDDPIELLTQLLGQKSAAELISNYFQRISVNSGEILFNQGDPGDTLYLILKGTVSIVLNLPDGQTLHLRTMRAGAILGEMAIYTGAVRSATAMINEDSILYRLDLDGYKKMNEHNLTEASLFHIFIVRLMSERLGRANKEIMALSR